MPVSRWRAQCELYGGAARKRREVAELARIRAKGDRMRPVFEAARNGDARAIRARDLYGKTGYDSDAVLEAYESGGPFPKRRYKTQQQRYWEEMQRRVLN